MEYLTGVLVGVIIVLMIVVIKIVRSAYLDAKDIRERNFWNYHKRRKNKDK